LRSQQLAALRTAWTRQRKELKESSAVQRFVERQVRQWCIQTGLIERIYTLDAGITVTLVEHGFDAAYVPHGSSDLPADRLVRVLNDHREAAAGLFAFVRSDRPSSTSYVKELHAALCRNQDVFEALDSLGRRVSVPLIKGAYKTQPNNPRDLDTGQVVFEYCPPEHVDSEMENLVRMHRSHRAVPMEIEAAWLHHRFVQLHPFQDGNGRVARALATLVCLRDGGFPLVVMAEEKPAYIEALRAADRGDLAPFAGLVARLQEEAIKQALSLGGEALQAPVGVDAILTDARRRIDQAAARQRLPVHERAEQLVDVARSALSDVEARFNASMAGAHGSPRAALMVLDSLSPLTATLAHQAQAAASKQGHEANVTGPQWHVRLDVQDPRGTASALAVSFHHLGPPERGVMVASAFFVRGAVQPLSDRTFSFTADMDETTMREQFRAWLEAAIFVGLDVWRRRL
jgi:fido (protein-threonine AMPylation protein)